HAKKYRSPHGPQASPTSTVRFFPPSSLVMISSGEATKPRARAKLLAVPSGRTLNGMPLSTSRQATFATVPSPPAASTRSVGCLRAFLKPRSLSVDWVLSAQPLPTAPINRSFHALPRQPLDCPFSLF